VIGRIVRVLAATAAVICCAGCESSSGEAPIAEWNVEPAARTAPRVAAERDSGSSGLSLARSTPRGSAQIIAGTGRFIGSGRPPRSDKEPDDEAGVTLNLVNLPISQATKIVVGDIVGADFVVDPKLDGKVTVHTAHPVRRAAALELFQSALRVSGAAVVKSGGLYKVVPGDQAATSGAGISTGPVDPDAYPLGERARVVQLHYVSASEMKRVLEPISSRGGIVRADDARNTLTLNGSPQEIATLEDAVAMFDIDTMRGMSFALVPVKSSDADALAEDLRNVFGSEKEGPMNGMVRFIGNKRLSSILVISPQPQYLTRARAWIQRLDARAEGSEKQFYTYRVQNRPAKELVQVLASMFGSDTGANRGSNVAPRFGPSSLSSGSPGGSPFGQSPNVPSNPLGALSATGPNTGGGLGGGGFGGSGGLGGNSGLGSSSSFGAGVGAQNGQQSGPAGPQSVALGEDSRFKLAVDEAKNALVVMATPEDYRRLLRIVETLDVIPNQVYIEATIAEVTLNDDLHFGVRWFLQKRASMAAFSSAAAGSPAATAGAPATVASTPSLNPLLGDNLLGAGLGAAFPGFSYALRASNVQVTLNALNAITNVNIVSTPSLTVMDNRQAMLQVGDQIPVTTLTSTTALGNTFNSVNYQNTGVILAITPHISESGRVMLDLEQEVSNVAPNSDPATTTPTIQQRKVKTQVVVNDSESLMLGGLIKDSRSRGSDQIPVLGDVPIFGNAFKDKTDSIGKTELLIMITPHVVRSLSEAREITDEYKRKLLEISTKAIARPHDIEQSSRRVLLDPWSVGPSAAERYSR
jgi:general secretion pathway protein D